MARESKAIQEVVNVKVPVVKIDAALAPVWCAPTHAATSASVGLGPRGRTARAVPNGGLARQAKPNHHDARHDVPQRGNRRWSGRTDGPRPVAELPPQNLCNSPELLALSPGQT